MVALLVETEHCDTQNRKTERLLKNAKFRYQASVEEIEFTRERNLDKGDVLRLATCDFINKKQSVIITGPTGAGKSYIASALGHQACINGHKVLYYNIYKLFTRLKMLKADGSDIREKAKIEKHDLLVLDGILRLEQNRPNPFDGTTEIEFETVEEGNTRLILSDVMGRVVSTLYNGTKPGIQTIKLNTTELNPGVYYYSLKTPTIILTRKL